MDDIARTLAAQYPENEGWHLNLVPYRDVVIGGVGPVLFVLLGAVGLVLLIACGNVASLLLARASARSGEMAVRTALGAGRGRLVRQLLTESLLLGVAAGIVGLAFGHYLLAGVRAVGDGLLPRLAEVEIDGTVLAFTFAISLVTSLVFGAAPALHAVRPDLAATMKSLGKASATKSGHRHARCARRRTGSTVVRPADRSGATRAEPVATTARRDRVRCVAPADGGNCVAEESLCRTGRRFEEFWTQFLDRVRAIPGVEGAGATTLLPLRGGGDTYFYIEGQPPASDAQKMNATVSTVTDDYFATMRIPLVTGRVFNAADRGDGAGVTVISQGLAKRLFPGASAIGKRLVVDFGKPFTAEIVGVVADVRVYGQANDAPDLMYFTNRQPNAGFGTGVMNLTARVRGDPNAITPQVRAALHAIDADVPLSATQSMESILL